MIFKREERNSRNKLKNMSRQRKMTEEESTIVIPTYLIDYNLLPSSL